MITEGYNVQNGVRGKFAKSVATRWPTYLYKSGLRSMEQLEIFFTTPPGWDAEPSSQICCLQQFARFPFSSPVQFVHLGEEAQRGVTFLVLLRKRNRIDLPGG